MMDVARGHPRACEGLTTTSHGVDCAVVGPSYGRFLQVVSNKISLQPVKLFARNNVTDPSNAQRAAGNTPARSDPTDYLIDARPAAVPAAFPDHAFRLIWQANRPLRGEWHLC
jgi:hypothetical protein